jgi:hypothetical protein
MAVAMLALDVTPGMENMLAIAVAVEVESRSGIDAVIEAEVSFSIKDISRVSI